MTSIIASIILGFAQALPSLITWIADAIKGGTLPDQLEVEKRIAAILASSTRLDAEEDAAASAVASILVPKNPHASER